MHQQCTQCHVALRATKPGSFVLRCPRCGRRFAAKPTAPNRAAAHRDDASGASGVDLPPFDSPFHHTSESFLSGPDHGAITSGSTDEASASHDASHDAGFGGGGGFDGGGSGDDF